MTRIRSSPAREANRGVYIVAPVMRDLFAHPDVTCGTLDGAFVCVDTARRTNLRDCLADP